MSATDTDWPTFIRCLAEAHRSGIGRDKPKKPKKTKAARSAAGPNAKK
jgi:hypothetical protein